MGGEGLGEGVGWVEGRIGIRGRMGGGRIGIRCKLVRGKIRIRT